MIYGWCKQLVFIFLSSFSSKDIYSEFLLSYQHWPSYFVFLQTYGTNNIYSDKCKETGCFVNKEALSSYCVDIVWIIRGKSWILHSSLFMEHWAGLKYTSNANRGTEFEGTEVL